MLENYTGRDPDANLSLLFSLLAEEKLLFIDVLELTDLVSTL